MPIWNDLGMRRVEPNASKTRRVAVSSTHYFPQMFVQMTADAAAGAGDGHGVVHAAGIDAGGVSCLWRWTRWADLEEPLKTRYMMCADSDYDDNEVNLRQLLGDGSAAGGEAVRGVLCLFAVAKEGPGLPPVPSNFAG